MQEGGAARREAITTATGTLYQYVGDAGLRRRIGETFNYHTSGHSLMHEKGRELKEKNGFLLFFFNTIYFVAGWFFIELETDRCASHILFEKKDEFTESPFPAIVGGKFIPLQKLPSKQKLSSTLFLKRYDEM